MAIVRDIGIAAAAALTLVFGWRSNPDEPQDVSASR
jgi:hypothetical protein